MAGSSKSAEGSHCTARGGEAAAALVRSTGSLALPGSRTIVHTHTRVLWLVHPGKQNGCWVAEPLQNAWFQSTDDALWIAADTVQSWEVMEILL